MMNGLRPSALRRWDFAVGRMPWWRRLTPAQIFVGSFAVLIAAGTVGMKTIPGLFAAEALTWEESLYTVTSAVCVTGLTVVDTGTRFTPLGQGYVLLLIQLGGLGMIAFTSLIILMLGGRLSLAHESVAGAAVETAFTLDLKRVVADIVRFTLALEAAGAIVLYFIWVPRFGWQGALWPAIFHSVSAFCNAGFSTFPNNLMEFQQSPGTLIVIMLLIVAGGMGFLTMEDLAPWRFRYGRAKGHRVSLQTRIVLITTALLIVSGAAAFAVLEWNGTLGHLPTADRIANAFFLSVTARTAGYNTIDYGQAADSTNFLTILLMMIGGSPGSTAGGIKTTTFALLGILAWSRLQGEETPSVLGRSIRKENVDRAVGLFVIAFGIVTLGILLLCVTERGGHAGGFLDRMFEAVSAFNTVGLSTGISAKVSSAGKLVIIALMFVGRVGPLSFAAALARSIKPSGQFRYAYEEVMVG